MSARDQFFGEGVRRRWETISEGIDGGEITYGLIQAFEQYVAGQDRTMGDALEVLRLDERAYNEVRVEQCLAEARDQWGHIEFSAEEPEDPEERDDMMQHYPAAGLIPPDTLGQQARGLALQFFEKAIADTGLEREEALERLGLSVDDVNRVRLRHTRDSGLQIDQDGDEPQHPSPDGGA